MGIGVRFRVSGLRVLKPETSKQLPQARSSCLKDSKSAAVCRHISIESVLMSKQGQNDLGA